MSDASEYHEVLRQHWGAFSQADTLQGFVDQWLALQCNRIPDVDAGILVFQHDWFPGQAAAWPGGHEVDENLLTFAGELFEKQSGLMHREREQFLIGLPVRLDQAVVAVVALRVNSHESRLAVCMEQLQWGIAWVELLLRRQRSGADQSSIQALQDANQVFACVLEEKTFAAAALALVNDLVVRFDCDRVSLGIVQRGQVKVAAVSHSAQLDERMNALRSLAAVMDECLMQRHSLQYPAGTGKEILREHRRHSRENGDAELLSVPVHAAEHYFTVLTLERACGQAFDDSVRQRLEAIVTLAGKLLHVLHRADRWYVTKLRDGMTDFAERLLGPRYPGYKLSALAIASVVLLLVFLPGNYRVTAETVLEGQSRRAVVAPFDGYIAVSEVRAGAQVNAGQRLASLDDRELRLERAAFASELHKLQRQFEQANAVGERAEANVLRARIDQAQAQLDLVQSRLARTDLVSPLRGVVVKGDLDQRQGSAVKQGELLFEVSPLDDFRLVLSVDEHQISDFAVGSQGTLVLASLTDLRLPIYVTRITPVTSARDGANLFRVEAALEALDPRLRPGMEGIAKIESGKRNLLWIWTRPLVRWWRLFWWEWGW